MKKSFILLMTVLASSWLMWSCNTAQDQAQEEEGGEQIALKVSPLTGSPEFADAALSLEGEPTMDGNKATFNFKVENYTLGEQTPGAGTNGLANSAKGQHIHFIVDNGPYSAHYEPVVEKEFEPGNHVILAFLSRSYHESVKNPNSYVLTQLQAGGQGEALDLSGPHLFYSRPKGTYKGDDTKKLMIDFFLINCDLSETGFKVKATISGDGYQHEETFTKWQPYVVEGLPLGEVKVRLELIDAEGNTVDSPFNPVERSVSLAAADAS
ncbi:MAG: hypothetical protein D6730_10155 [Bacteroidetes bacterium]|nr:MAG: hypothetical protein D6730_10155 [Bacteroidota bacterium]